MDEAGRMRVMIVDDEPPAVERLSAMVAAFSDCRVVGCESRPEKALERCCRLRPDAVLLDVEMPGTSGLEIASRLQDLDPVPAVIFITAHDQYAVDAFGVEAVDYVVKPVREARLRQALERVSSARRIEQAWVSARIGERLVRIPLDEIRAFTAEDKCTLVHAVHAQAVTDDPLKSIEVEFGDRFVRIHRNALASRHHLKSLFTDRADVVRVEIEGVDLQPEVSRRNHTQVKKLLSGSL